MENTTPASTPMTDLKPKLQVNNLNFYYGGFHALRNVNMTIAENKVTAFIGPSGCGKVGMVFQKPTPFPMSIYDNIAFGVRLFEQLPKAEMDERVHWALSKAALWTEVKDKLNQSGHSLSGGQQQRLCIARGVAIKPEVLLLDEPCSALDPISTAKVEELITELKNDYTVVIVTHNMQQAARCSDFTAYMYLGELMEFGETDQIFVKPSRKETEDYITGRFG